MNARQLLIARRDKLQKLFDIEANKEAEARDEKLRLQGEYRVLTQIIDSDKKKEK